MTAAHPVTPDSVAYTVPGMTEDDGLLQDRLNALNDLALTLKHVHWNVTGPHFIAVHTMLDPQVDGVREMVDTTAERIATLGGSPDGTPGAIVKERHWDDYSLGRADALAHMGALDLVYDGIIAGHREAIEQIEEADPVSEDMLVEQAAELEKYHWFVRAHLERDDGSLATQGTDTEVDAAERARTLSSASG
jgi:starvation-inducible DNA-binding protein